jgi:hypothetical protein
VLAELVRAEPVVESHASDSVGQTSTTLRDARRPERLCPRGHRRLRWTGPVGRCLGWSPQVPSPPR